MRTKFDVPETQFPRTRDGLETIFDKRLGDIYLDRFNWRRSHEEDWEPWVFREALHQACILGQLTALAFAYHTGVVEDEVRYSFERRDEQAKLGTKHLDWARDMYGYMTNSGAKNKRGRRHFKELELCHVDLAAEINEPCPFCHG